MKTLSDVDRAGGWPNLIIAGTQKAGTTWLHNCLARHPRVRMSQPKELDYFGSDDWRSEERRASYRSHFIPDPDITIHGESTPSYLWHKSAHVPYSPPVGPGGDAADAIYETLADQVLIIVMLRSPVDRAIAGANHQLVMGRLTPDADLFSADPALGVIDLGFYRRHLEYWYSVFDACQVQVLLYDDLVENPVALLGRAFRLLGLSVDDLDDRQRALSIEPSNTNAELRLRQHVDDDVQLCLDDGIIEQLVALYADDIEYVEQITGRRLDRWRDIDRVGG